MARHTCKYFTPAHRGSRRCKFCNRQQFRVGGKWRWSMTLQQFAYRWLPAVSGTKPEDMLTVKVAFPFEWNCYETWNVVFRVWVQLPEVARRRQHGLGTPADILNGWMSKYAQDFCIIDYEAEQYFEKRTGKPFQIGDNTYGAMREIIQS